MTVLGGDLRNTLTTLLMDVRMTITTFKMRCNKVTTLASKATPSIEQFSTRKMHFHLPFFVSTLFRTKGKAPQASVKIVLQINVFISKSGVPSLVSGENFKISIKPG